MPESEDETRTYRTSVNIDRDAAEKFRDKLPHIPVSHFINECLRKFNEIHEDQLDEDIQAAVEFTSRSLMETE